MSKFTAGEWRIGVHPTDSSPFAVVESDSQYICQTVGGNDLANAHLIASAPDMFRDLNEAANLIDFLSVHLEGRMGEGALMDMQVKAESWRETLAKAEGKS